METKKSSKSFKRKKAPSRKTGAKVGAKEARQLALFVSVYINGFNAGEAYHALHPDISKASARAEGSKFLARPNVIREIDSQLQSLFESIDLKNESILAEQMKIAFVDVRGFYDENGAFKGMNNLNIAQQSAIEALEIEELYEGTGSNRVHTGRTTKIKFYNRQKAIDSLMKYNGMIKESNNFNFKINNNIENAELKVDVAALKEKLGADTIIELNRRLSTSGQN
jgi:phage terminase small subunit